MVPAVPPVIHAIRFERHDIYVAREARSFLPRLVNRLHIQTRRGVIEREVLFAVGEPYDSARVAETERILRSLGVFRRVRVDTVRSDSGLGDYGFLVTAHHHQDEVMDYAG